MPRTTSSMPSVTRNEGTRNRVTNQPLTRPMATPMTMAMTNPTSMPRVVSLATVHMTTAVKPKTEPTERSNSPDVMSSVMAKAIMPSSGVKAMRLLMLPTEMKVADSSVKAMMAPISSAKGPASGCASSRRKRSPSDGFAAVAAAVMSLPRTGGSRLCPVVVTVVDRRRTRMAAPIDVRPWRRVHGADGRAVTRPRGWRRRRRRCQPRRAHRR